MQDPIFALEQAFPAEFTCLMVKTILDVEILADPNFSNEG